LRDYHFYRPRCYKDGWHGKWHCLMVQENFNCIIEVVCGQKELQAVYDNVSTPKMVKDDFKVPWNVNKWLKCNQISQVFIQLGLVK
jgi:hypothetical protein